MDIPGRVSPGAEGAKAPLAQSVEDGLGHDAAGRVAGAKEEYVIDPVGHDRPLLMVLSERRCTELCLLHQYVMTL